jgi:hypothetical protein
MDKLDGRGPRLDAIQRCAAGCPPAGSAPAGVGEVLRSPGEPLDAATRGYLEPRFGHDFGRVRVHADDRAAASARAVDALAYTFSNHIVFAAGRYQPGTADGQRLLRHELTHVVQQSGSPAVSSVSAATEVGASDSPFEAEARRWEHSDSAPVTPSGQVVARQTVEAEPSEPEPLEREEAEPEVFGAEPEAIPEEEAEALTPGERSLPPELLRQLIEARRDLEREALARQRPPLVTETAPRVAPDNPDRHRLEDLDRWYYDPYFKRELEGFVFDLERPIATLDRGGAPPSFTTTEPARRIIVHWRGYEFDLPVRPQRFHILDAIRDAVERARTPEDAERRVAEYLGLPRLPRPGEIELPGLRLWILPPGLDPDRTKRTQVFVDALKQRYPTPSPAVGLEAAPAERERGRRRRRRTQKCFAPSERLGAGRASPLGYVAQVFIENDYCSRLGCVPGLTAYFDESLAGGIDPNYVRFIVQRNPTLSSAAQVFLSDPVKRPDILLHLDALREFEEIKPDSGAGLYAGYLKVFEIDYYMRIFNLYARGRTYRPTPVIPITRLTVNGELVEYEFHVRREAAGLIVYELCITTDFDRVRATVPALVQRLVEWIIRTRARSAGGGGGP